jgi:hypothetical protein
MMSTGDIDITINPFFFLLCHRLEAPQPDSAACTASGTRCQCQPLPYAAG